MANELVLGKLRFDTAALEQQLADVTKRINEVKQLAAQVKAAGGSSKAGQSVNKQAETEVKNLAKAYETMGKAGVDAAQKIAKHFADAQKQLNKDQLKAATEEYRR